MANLETESRLLDLANDLLYNLKNFENRLSNFLYSSGYDYLMKNEANESLKYDGRDFEKLYQSVKSSIQSGITKKIEEYDSFCKKTFEKQKSILTTSNEEFVKYKTFAKVFCDDFASLYEKTKAENFVQSIIDAEKLESVLQNYVPRTADISIRKAYMKIDQTKLYCYRKIVETKADEEDLSEILDNYSNCIRAYESNYDVSKDDETVENHRATHGRGTQKNAILLGNAALEVGDYEKAFSITDKALAINGFFRELTESVRRIWIDSYNVLSANACKEYNLKEVYRFLDKGLAFENKDAFCIDTMKNNVNIDDNLALPTIRTFLFAIENFEKFDYGVVKSNTAFLKSVLNDLSYYKVTRETDVQQLFSIRTKLWYKNEQRTTAVDFNNLFFTYRKETVKSIESLFSFLDEKDYLPKIDFLDKLDKAFLSKLDLKAVDCNYLLWFSSLSILYRKKRFEEKTRDIKKSRYSYKKDIEQTDLLPYATLAILRSPKAIASLRVDNEKTESKYNDLYAYAYRYFFGVTPKKMPKYKTLKTDKNFDVTASTITSNERKRKTVIGITVSAGIVAVAVVITILFFFVF